MTINSDNNKSDGKKQETHFKNSLVSVVVPCFNESTVIHTFYQELKKVLLTLDDTEHEIIFIDDGSIDDTLEQLNKIASNDSCVRVGSFSRNFGHQIALTAGIDAARGEALITLDADLQHPPELIPKMIQKWKEGYDIVSAVRNSTEGASFFKKITSRGFYYFLNMLSDTHIPQGVADFNLFSRRAYTVLKNMPEKHRFLRGMTSWIGFKRAFLSYSAAKRAAGESKYTLFKMVSMACDAIFSFSSVLLRIVTRIGLIIMILGFIYLAWILQRYYFKGDTVHGWTSLIGVTLILGGFNLITMGILGQYISKVFEEIKRRPMYILKQEPDCHGHCESQENRSCDFSSEP